MAQRDAIETIPIHSVWAFALLLLVVLSACSRTPKSPDVSMPLIAHLTDADGTPVPNDPEPEVVQLKSVETVDRTLHVTVGNAAGDYVLVCNLDANTEVGPKSCSAPDPQRNYLLFRNPNNRRKKNFGKFICSAARKKMGIFLANRKGRRSGNPQSSESSKNCSRRPGQKIRFTIG